MEPRRFAIFETAIGDCALVWSPAGVAGVCLPEQTRSRLERLVQQGFPGTSVQSPSPREAAIVGRIQALMRGEQVDFSAVPLDLDDVPDFHRRVYAATRAIPQGETRTYGQLAETLGEPGAARAVGQALGRNPVPVIVPCHRVLAAGGRAGGFSAPGGVVTKQRILALEGVELALQPDLFEG